jgi:Gpi18-like mannosyltransferase
MKDNSSIRNLILIWFGWAVVMLAFQHWIGARLELTPPDYALNWTAGETTPVSQNGRPTLLDPFMNEQVAWDSEFYLSIAIDGYDDPAVRGITSKFAWSNYPQQVCAPQPDTDCAALNYAFFPLYSWLTRAMALPLLLLPLTAIARATLAAVIISLLGTLGAMLSLYFMSRESLGEEGGIRAAFYFLIFPSGFFLAQVYTEGLFLGLTFGALAFLLARKWGWSALLAALAVWARPGGAILLLPMVIAWLMDRSWQGSWKSALMRGLAVLSPAISYGVWAISPLAEKFHRVESLYFNRKLLAIGSSVDVWGQALQTFAHDNSQAKVYYALEFAAIFLAVAACLLLFRERPEISAFGLAMVVFSLTSGVPQGMIRYVLAAPAMFWVLARWGGNTVFDKVWTLVSVLLLGVEVMLFSFNFWVA